jgi:hypothetical protein
MTILEADARIEKLSAASLLRVIEPDVDVPGEVGPGQLLAPSLLSVAGLDLDLTAEQQATLSREEIASIVDSGVRFEAVLMSGFALQLAGAPDLTDPRVVYALHEMGEETRHSRLFIRLLSQLRPVAKNPLDRPIFRRLQSFGIGLISRRPALLDTLVLAGEEIPDLLQKEARHLAFARTVLPEHWASARWHDRFAVHRIAPVVIQGMFEMMVHPGVYRTVGLPGWKTWRAANRTPQRVALRHEAARSVLGALLNAGVMRAGHIPRGWRRLCGVDAAGVPSA